MEDNNNKEVMDKLMEQDQEEQQRTRLKANGGGRGGDGSDHRQMNRSSSSCMMPDDHVVAVEDNNHNHHELLAEINGADLIFTDVDVFPSLPHFPSLSSPSCSSSFAAPCRSSSSSSSSTSSSSSSTSWAVVKSNVVEDDEKGAPLPPLPAEEGVDSGGVDLLGGMDLLDEDLWNPSSLFPEVDEEQNQSSSPQPPQSQLPPAMLPPEDDDTTVHLDGTGSSEDLAVVFFEWLKSNKEVISPEDLKNIKLKKSTIDTAVHRLGGGKEGMKQLLKLILSWVQNHHLEQKRRLQPPETAAINYSSQFTNNPLVPITSTLPPISIPYSDEFCNWVPSPVDQMIPGFNFAGGVPEVTSPIGGTDSLHAAEPISIWLPPPPQSQYPLFPSPAAVPSGFPPAYFGRQLPMATSPTSYFCQKGESLITRFGSSATKEARKKRMARQRRFLSLHHHRNNHQIQQQQQQQQQLSSSLTSSHGGAGGGNGMSSGGTWPVKGMVPNPVPPASSTQQQQPTSGAAKANHSPVVAAPVGRSQGWKSEKNLRFLLQKVLKQSDVGSLGRIVLPKKEAETHLPELEARDGIPIVMEDIGTSRTWHMRYRFWPNNKSRMYLLENTGDFVRSNGLHEGDFIVIYSDVKCGKFMIRGVKVRNQTDALKADAGRNTGKKAFPQSAINGYYCDNNSIEEESYNEKTSDLVDHHQHYLTTDEMT